MPQARFYERFHSERDEKAGGVPQIAGFVRLVGRKVKVFTSIGDVLLALKQTTKISARFCILQLLPSEEKAGKVNQWNPGRIPAEETAV